MSAEVDRHYRENLWAALRGADPAAAARLPKEASVAQLRAAFRTTAMGLSESERHDVVRQLAKERAGLVEPVELDDLSATARALRVGFDLGEVFERRLAREIGHDAARRLRQAQDGWGGTQMITAAIDCAEKALEE